MKKKINVAILYGGFSSEREISLKTGRAVYEALKDSEKYNVFLVDLKANNYLQKVLELKNKKVDLIFIALHGYFGEDGKLQVLLDSLKMRYTGSNAAASLIAMNKHYTKLILRSYNILTPDWLLANKYDFKQICEKIKEKKFKYPLIIKPCNEGSTIGISLVKKKEQLNKCLENAFKYDKNILIEKFIEGREISVPILGDQVLPFIEIKPKLNIYYDFNSKYNFNGATHIIHPELNKNLYQKIKNTAKKAYNAIGCEVVARIDFIVEKKTNKVYLLEINTIPGMTEVSLLPESAKYAGISFGELVEKIIIFSLNKK